MKRHILIVDDNEANRYAMARYLRNEGYTVLEAGSGAEALELAQQQPSLIILDVKLPDILGFEVCRRLKQGEKTRHIPVLQTSATFVHSSDLVAGVESGADAYLRSPFEPAELIAAARSLIRLSKAEKQVERIQGEWQASMNAVRDCFCLVAPTGAIELSNAAFDVLFRGGDVWETSFPRLLGRQGLEASAFFRSLETGQSEISRHITDDSCWVLSAHPLLSGDLERSIVCILADHTDEWKAEKQLLESERRFRRLADAIPQLVWVVDASGIISLANSRWEEFFKDSGDTIESWFEKVHPEDLEETRKEWEACVSNGLPFEVEHRYRDRENRLYAWHLTRGVPDSETQGVRQWFFTSTLIEDQKRAEHSMKAAKEEAEIANRTKSAFLANMSHEIRTPLTSIIGFAEVLRERSDSEDKEIVDTIWQSAQHLLETLNSVLDLARLEGRQLTFPRTDVDVNVVARSLAPQFQLLAREAKIEFALDLQESDSMLILGDKAALSRVLSNLLSNAIKFTDSGSVTLKTRRERDKIVVEVSDTGIGISDEMKARLFQPFNQETEGMAGKRQGIGLGLAITKELVTLMHGEILVESTREEGTSFYVCFATSEKERRIAESAQFDASLGPGAAVRTGRLLLVEDNGAIIQIVKALTEHKHEVVVAPTPEDAMHALDQDRYSAILLDFNLGAEENGQDILNQIRLRTHLETTPVIAFTAFALPEDRSRFLSMGFSEYLSKPFTAQDLRAVLSRVGLDTV